MPSFRPRSIVSLILVGFAVVLAPFVAAVVTAVVQVDRFAYQSRFAVLNVRTATEASRSLVEQVVEMQRALGQYAVRGDPDFFGFYLDQRAGFRVSLSELRALDLAGFDQERLSTLAGDEAAIFERLSSGNEPLPDGNWEAAVESLATLTSFSRAVRTEIEQLAQENANNVTTRAESLQRTLLVIAAAAVPATVILVVVFTVLITRPMRALGGAIRRLGAHSLDHPIAVKGPRDVEALAQELEWLRRRIQALEEQKATFLQHISHELKTPLTTIREGSELLTESLGDGRQEEAEIARLLRASGLHLQQLIENLLQFARTQDLAIDLEFEPEVDLSLLIAESVAALAIIAEAKEVEMRVSLAVVGAHCDRSKIRTVIDNLLTNAIKYTPQNGHVDIGLSLDGANAVIDVRDSGPGVARDEQQQIFEPFKQGSAEYQSSIKGTGLGLSIAREYVDAHGGKLELIASQSGAHFRVVLPLAGPATALGGD